MGAGTIRHDAWSDLETSLLQGVVNDANWFEQVRPLILRSEAAIRAKMCALRREAGIIPRQRGPSAKSAGFMIRQSASVGSDKLRRAIEEFAA